MAIPGGDLQPLDRPIRIRLSRRQLSGIDRLAAEFGISRSWFIREALALGLPLAEERIRKLIEDGFRPAGDAARVPASGPRRGPISDGARPESLGLRARGSPSPSPRSRPCLRRGVRVSWPPVPSSGLDGLSLALRRPFFAIRSRRCRAVVVRGRDCRPGSSVALCSTSADRDHRPGARSGIRERFPPRPTAGTTGRLPRSPVPPLGRRGT